MDDGGIIEETDTERLKPAEIRSSGQSPRASGHQPTAVGMAGGKQGRRQYLT
jgi:hypothetical protein